MYVSKSMKVKWPMLSDDTHNRYWLCIRHSTRGNVCVIGIFWAFFSHGWYMMVQHDWWDPTLYIWDPSPFPQHLPLLSLASDKISLAKQLQIPQQHDTTTGLWGYLWHNRHGILEQIFFSYLEETYISVIKRGYGSTGQQFLDMRNHSFQFIFNIHIYLLTIKNWLHKWYF